MTGVQTCALPIWLKRVGNIVIKDYHEQKSDIYRFTNLLKSYLKRIGKKYLNELNDDEYKYVDNIQSIIENAQSIQRIVGQQILWLNQRLDHICMMYDEHKLPLHVFASLCGVNLKLAEMNVNSEYSLCTDDDLVEKTGKHYLYLDNIEDERTEEGWKYNRYGMPMFDLTKERIFVSMDLNKEIKVKMDDVFDDCFPELRGSMYTFKKTRTVMKY